MIDDRWFAEAFNDYFNNIVQDLVLKIPDALNHHSLKNKDPFVNVISKY